MAQTNSKYGLHALNIGETVVCAAPGEIVCYGLGSCLGVFLYDKFQKVGAGAHILSPGNGEEHKSDQMLDDIINGMLDKGCHRLTIRARLVGGANILNLHAYRIGYRNTIYVKKELRKKGIVVSSEDTGGTKSRTARLDVESGILSVNNARKNYYTI
ncbi:chemotaxis protein CheD [Fulvivirgaceae bacterium BMA12]|uniref:Probable chemoreceptor glutamine deamidase CheD n=1 Tax=Agaribacillus aureus TaxID=3051825 RepID=A0ABT8L4R8_9BACT|nr:chemotaxis protein CheD [Fulvivirgaceae bacterium BMA12]